MSESENEEAREYDSVRGAAADVLKRLRVANAGLAPGDPRILQAVVTLFFFFFFLHIMFKCSSFLRVSTLL